MAILFFILAGNFQTHGGVARRMINFATSMVGHWHGGLALGAVVACALFPAVSGSSPATVVVADDAGVPDVDYLHSADIAVAAESDFQLNRIGQKTVGRLCRPAVFFTLAQNLIWIRPTHCK